MKIPLLSGETADQLGEYRKSYPINLEAVAQPTMIAAGQLRGTAGSIPYAAAGPGIDRGGINWNGVCYRVMGSRLVSFNNDFSITDIGDVGTDGLPIKMDYSFDRLGIRSGSNLYYYDGKTLIQVTDPSLGRCLDFIWIDGYFMITDGNDVITTNLADPTTIDPLHYGSAEEDPDSITGLIKCRGEAYVCGTNTIETLRNVGGSGFPYVTLTGATIPYGVVGPMAKCIFGQQMYYGQTMAFVGSGRNETLGVFQTTFGTANRISNRWIDDQLAAVTDQSSIVLESRTYRGEQRLFVHLPDKTLVYLATASQALQQPVWYIAQSGIGHPYRQRFAVQAYNQFIVGDTQCPQLGYLTDTAMTQFGEPAQWQFDVGPVYNGSKGGIVHSVELVGLPGRAPVGEDPRAYMSLTRDGVNFTTERPVSMGAAGKTRHRMQWRPRSSFRSTIGFRFRGINKALPGFAACEADISPLAV